MGQPEEARKTYAKLGSIARTDGERRQAHFWTAMSYVHEGATQQALSELQQMAAIDQAGSDLVALAGVTAQMGNVLLEAGRADEAAAKYRERSATIDKAEVATQVKEAAHRQALFDEALVALARNDLVAAKAKAGAYDTAVTAKGIPFELRQNHELAGRIALAAKDYASAAAELRQANQQDPRVLYLTAVALQGKGDSQAAKDVATQAAEWNGLSNTYGFVRGKARELASAKPRG
jgi:tetratricopeptide (TPR) repeat protein